MQTHFDILIIGGGTAGLTVASQLTGRAAGATIGVIEPSSVHYYQPLWTLVGGGIFPKEDSRRNEADLIPEGVTWIREAAVAIDPDARTVQTSVTGALTYGYLVIAAGVQLRW